MTQGDIPAHCSKTRGRVRLERRSSPMQVVGLARFWYVVKMEPTG